MQAIVIKYIQLFCVAVLFDNVSCDQIKLKNYEDQLLFYRTTSCTAVCLNNYPEKELKECYEQICQYRRFNETEPKRRNASNFTIKLHCRDDTSLVVQIVDNHERELGNMKYYSKKGEKGNLYMVKVERENLLETVLYIANSSLIQIKNLESNTTYNITATVMHSNLEYTNAIKVESIATLAEGYKPNVVKNADYSGFKLSNSSSKALDTFLLWDPGEDHTCHFFIYKFIGDEIDDEKSVELINDPELLYQYPIRNLDFGSHHLVSILAVSRVKALSKNLTTVHITTPTCWEWYNDTNLEICPPYEPTNIVATAIAVSTDVYRLNVSWDKPETEPSSYLMYIIDENNSFETVVSGDRTYQFFDEITLFCNECFVELQAYSKGGNASGVANFFTEVVTVVAEKDESLELALYIGSSIIVAVLLCVLIAIFIHIRSRSKERQDEVDNFKGLDHHIGIQNGDKRALFDEMINEWIVNDGLEIDEKDIDIGDDIGSGAFGYVKRGFLLTTGEEVAIKMLKDVVTFDVMQNFCREIKVMKSIDKHPNIVGIVGHCTKNIGNMMLLTEYCSEGNLLQFLRNHLERLMKYSLTESHPKKAITDEYFSFRKPSESEFNFDSSIPEKNITKQTNIPNIDDNIPVLIKNLINNKLYDECSDNFDSKRIFAHECGNSCISYVDIVEDGYNNKERINVKDCDCSENKKNEILSPFNQRNSMVENPGYDVECKLTNDAPEKYLTRKDLLSIALQIATGMEFLALNKFVHRDLAARNVCVCSDYTVKIADFGLSRDVYQENVYKKETDGKLPIKWLALESMTFQIYTSQSDVWSFGILLYEIVTLGSVPYPSLLSATSLLEFLTSGGRMSKPETCDDDLYEIMSSCWRTMPSDRPTFTEIKLKLQWLLSTLTDNRPVYNKTFDNLRSITGSYLAPI